jgi:hypothetical protein
VNVKSPRTTNDPIKNQGIGRHLPRAIDVIHLPIVCAVADGTSTVAEEGFERIPAVLLLSDEDELEGLVMVGVSRRSS